MLNIIIHNVEDFGLLFDQVQDSTYSTHQSGSGSKIIKMSKISGHFKVKVYMHLVATINFKMF